MKLHSRSLKLLLTSTRAETFSETAEDGQLKSRTSSLLLRSCRNDIPKDDVPSDVRRKPGEKYMDLDSRPEWSDMEPVRKLLNDTVKEAKK